MRYRRPRRRPRSTSTEQETLRRTNTTTTDDTANGDNIVQPTETCVEDPSSIKAEIEQTEENVQNENGHNNDAFETQELTNSSKSPAEDDGATENEKDQAL